MKKIKYQENWKETYWDIFTISQKRQLQKDWYKLQKKYNCLLFFPNRIKRIITGDFNKLTNYFFLFNKILSFMKETDRKNILGEIAIVFNYDNYREAIAKYFFTRIKDMNIFSCFYCDIHIIGKYELEADNITIKEYRTFDVDHFFENAQCPLLALSIKNFVPSCQICNMRVKGKKDFFVFYGFNKIKYSENQLKKILSFISPTSNNGNFNDYISIKVIPKLGFSDKICFLDNIENYEIKFSSTDIFTHHINAFRLNERYNSITILSEALSLMDLKLKYPPKKIIEIKNQLKEMKISEENIEEIIFRKKYDEKRHSNLMKLKKNILE